MHPFLISYFKIHCGFKHRLTCHTVGTLPLQGCKQKQKNDSLIIFTKMLFFDVLLKNITIFTKYLVKIFLCSKNKATLSSNNVEKRLRISFNIPKQLIRQIHQNNVCHCDGYQSKSHKGVNNCVYVKVRPVSNYTSNCGTKLVLTSP